MRQRVSRRAHGRHGGARGLTRGQRGARGPTQLSVLVLAATSGPGAQRGPVVGGDAKHEPGAQQRRPVAAHEGLEAGGVAGEPRQDAQRAGARRARRARHVGQQAAQGRPGHQRPAGVGSLGEARQQQQRWPLAAPGLLGGSGGGAAGGRAQGAGRPQRGRAQGGAGPTDRLWRRRTALRGPVGRDVSRVCSIALGDQPGPAEGERGDGTQSRGEGAGPKDRLCKRR